MNKVEFKIYMRKNIQDNFDIFPREAAANSMAWKKKHKMQFGI